MTATSLYTVSERMARIENDLDPVRDHRANAQVSLIISIAFLAVGIFLAIATTGGIYWRIGALAMTIPLAIGGFVYAAYQYYKSKNCAQETGGTGETGKAADDLARENALKFNFQLAVNGDLRKQRIEKMSDMGYMAFLKHVESSYFCDGQLNPLFTSLPDQLFSSLKVRENWESLAKRVVCPALIRCISDAQ